MRNWIIGAAAILAVAVPSVAVAQTGYVGAVYGNADAGAGDEDFYGVEGAVAFAGSGSIVFEVDASITDSDETDTGYGVVGHVYSRNDSHLFGGFVGIAGNNDDADTDGYGANVEARAFVNDNFRLNANIGLASIDTGADDEDVTIYGVGGEYQLANVPVSFTAGWNTADFDGGDVDVWTIGVRYNFGGQTLRDRDRNGASQANVVSGLGAAL